MNTSRLLTGLTAALAATALALPAALADTPALFPVQGYLTDADGAPIDGQVDMRFSIYQEGDETALWSEIVEVTVDQGAFTYYLGSEQALSPDFFASAPSMTLGIKVGTDSEMSPRMALGSVPYAARASSAAVADLATQATNATTADTAMALDGFNPLDFVPRNEAGAVTPGMLAADSVDVDAVDGALPIYRVTNHYCNESPGTLSFTSTCYASQRNVDSCTNLCLTGYRRARDCSGGCVCASNQVLCIPRPGIPCPGPTPWTHIDRCDNTLVGHILPQ
ncbi:hypothetical protein FRC98_19090 [Lujinxingia vulgaris]|uniref:Uncharacterized protein n=1 Tax=Lujinxingia vulgaris TaxID=2600176 RepID=A0A5C6WXH5_9DELT|nr:hypothetical protein [Lujinxingia vulgaris]TXD34144.1 hypothetical protein FRC98_19090 [Lujinxingia vulgaris]